MEQLVSVRRRHTENRASRTGQKHKLGPLTEQFSGRWKMCRPFRRGARVVLQVPASLGACCLRRQLFGCADAHATIRACLPCTCACALISWKRRGREEGCQGGVVQRARHEARDPKRWPDERRFGTRTALGGRPGATGTSILHSCLPNPTRQQHARHEHPAPSSDFGDDGSALHILTRLLPGPRNLVGRCSRRPRILTGREVVFVVPLPPSSLGSSRSETAFEPKQQTGPPAKALVCRAEPRVASHCQRLHSEHQHRSPHRRLSPSLPLRLNRPSQAFVW